VEAKKKENIFLYSATDITEIKLPDENELPAQLVLPESFEILKENIIYYIAEDI